MRKKTTTRVSKIVKNRNANTMSESMFWSFIRASLRRRTIAWKPIQLCKQNSKRKYSGTNKRQRFEYKCNSCGLYFPEKEINVDHILPAGSLKCSADLEGFINRLFCEVGGLQTLCSTCHDRKTLQEKQKK